MKLSIIILCWNDLKVIGDCLSSIYATTHATDFEVIVPDNGSTDGSIEFIRQNYPQVRVIENGKNLRFAKANNVGIRESKGEYVLILNPDTIIHEGTLDKIVLLADRHPEAGAFGCRVLNADGTYQGCIRPLPSIRSEWIAALHLNALAYLSPWFEPGLYVDWHGETERTVGWLAGCFIMLRAELLKTLGGFDEQFFYYHEDMDLCRRVWQSGHSILYTPEVSITHLGGQSTSKRFPPLAFALDGQITRYRYYYKHHGRQGARSARTVILASLLLRCASYRLLQLAKPSDDRKARLEQMRILFDWNFRVDPVRLVENSEEPDLGINLPARVAER
jgi:GT2 family glycosyltransferase